MARFRLKAAAASTVARAVSICPVCCDADFAAVCNEAERHVFLSSSTHLTHCLRHSHQDLPNIVVFAGLVKRTGQLQAALAASQADLQTIKNLLVQQKSQHSATKASMNTAATQHRRLTRQYASLKKALRRSNRQKADLQQKAVQLQQLSSSLMDMSHSMQQVNSDMGSEMQLLRAEVSKLQDQLSALHRRAASPQIKAGVGEAVEVAAGGASMKQTLKQVRAAHDAGCARMCCDLQSSLTHSFAC